MTNFLFSLFPILLFSSLRLQRRTATLPSALARSLLFALAIVSLAGTAVTQTDLASGIQPFSTQIGGPYDSVDLATSNIMLHIPVRSKNEKIPFSYAIVGNFHTYTYPNVNNHNIPMWNVTTGLGGTDNLRVSITSSDRTITCNGKSNDIESYAFAIVDLSGASHPLPLAIKIDNDGCDPSPVTATATDGSGYTMQIAPTAQGAPYYNF